MFDLSRISIVSTKNTWIEALITTLSTTTIKRGSDLNKLQQGSAAAYLILPQPVHLCLKFSSDGEKREFAVSGVFGTIASFILDGH